MRVLLLLVVVLGVVLWWKHNQRGRRAQKASPPPAAPGSPEVMLRCAECGVHLPSSQALPGKGGHFCSAEHRQSFEARGGE